MCYIIVCMSLAPSLTRRGRFRFAKQRRSRSASQLVVRLPPTAPAAARAFIYVSMCTIILLSTLSEKIFINMTRCKFNMMSDSVIHSVITRTILGTLQMWLTDVTNPSKWVSMMKSWSDVIWPQQRPSHVSQGPGETVDNVWTIFSR